MNVIALQSFDHGQRVRRGELLDVSDITAHRLLARKLVALPTNLPRQDPFSAAGAEQPSSASPVAPALLQTTATLFDDGVSPAKVKRRRGASSSSTPVTG